MTTAIKTNLNSLSEDILTLNVSNRSIKMPIKYIVLSESNHYGWVGGFTTLTEAEKMLKIETETFYIFKHVHKKQPFQMKIRYPIGEYYDGLSINVYY